MTPHAAPDFLTANDALVARRDAIEGELVARSEYRDSITDPVIRAIGGELTRQEVRAARLGHLGSLGHLAANFDTVPGASSRVHIALQRARSQGNYSSLEALERELDRDRDEELSAAALLLLTH